MSTLPIKYNGEFEWNITDPSFVSKFLAAPAGALFSSDTFVIGGLEWEIHAYPKGKFEAPKQKQDHIEGCELYLQLLSKSWPNRMKKIIFNYRLYCPAANSSFTNVHSWQKSDKKYFVHWFRGTLTTKELEACEGGQIKFKCYINILRIINFVYDRKSRNRGFNRSKQVQISPVKYQFPFKLSSIDPSNPNKNIFEYEYKVHNIEELFLNTKCGKHLESPIFDNLWCLRIAPKGWKLKDQKYVCLWLQLCGLPINISELKVRFTVKCLETNTIHHSKDRYFKYYFHNQYAGWNQKKLLTKSLKKLLQKTDALTFQVRITILAKYDLNMNEIPMIKSSNNWIRSENFESAGSGNTNNRTQYVPKMDKGSVKHNEESNMFESAPQYKPKRASKWIRSRATDDKKEDVAIAAPAAAVSPIIDQVVDTAQEYIPGPGNVDAEEEKSSEIDGLRQQIVRLNHKVTTMQQTIDYLQSKLGMARNDEMKENTFDGEQSIVEMLRETKNEIIELKKFTGLSGFCVNVSESYSNPVQRWLSNVVGLPQYYKNFEENGFDTIVSVKRLIMEQLEILGINKLGHKMQIMAAIDDLKKGDKEIVSNANLVSEGVNQTGNTKYI